MRVSYGSEEIDERYRATRPASILLARHNGCMNSTPEPDEVLRELVLSRAWNAHWLRPSGRERQNRWPRSTRSPPACLR